MKNQLAGTCSGIAKNNSIKTPEMTPQEIVIILERAYGWQRGKGIPAVDAALFAADIVRRVVSGEYAPVVYGKWLNFAGDFSTAECNKCGEAFEVSPDEKPSEDFFNAFKQSYKVCPACGARMIESHSENSYNTEDNPPVDGDKGPAALPKRSTVMPMAHGYWEIDEDGHKCSHCHEYLTDEQFEYGEKTYCPSCGAVMDESDVGQTHHGKDDSHA